jgi:hypothetical protein
MTTLSQKEREDLQTVFSSISDAEPTRHGRLERLKFFIFSHTVSRFFPLSKKRVSYQE